MRMEAESRQKAETPNPAPKKSTRVILLFSSTRAGEPTGVIHPHLGKANGTAGDGPVVVFPKIVYHGKSHQKG